MAALHAPVTGTAAQTARTTRTARAARTARTARRGTRLGGVVAALALSAAACGGADSGADVEIEATPAALAEAAQRSASQPYRMDMSFAMRAAGEGEELAFEVPLMSGEVDGDKTEFQMDLQPMFEEFAELAEEAGDSSELPDGDLTMDMAGDTEVLYIRAPFFATLADELPPTEADALGVTELSELGDLGDQWGRVDLTALEDFSVTELQNTAGAPSGNDPRVMLDLIAGSESVESLRSDEIDGNDVEGLAAEIGLADMLDAQGIDSEEFLDQMTGNLGVGGGGDLGVDPDEFASALFETKLPFEVWVNGDNLVRRVSFEMDFVRIFAEFADEIPGFDAVDEFTWGTTMDYFDYGADDISIELPTDAVDVTDTYEGLLTAGESAS